MYVNIQQLACQHTNLTCQHTHKLRVSKYDSIVNVKKSRDNIKTYLSTNDCHQTESCMQSFDWHIFIWSWPILKFMVRRFWEANNLTARAVTRTPKHSKTLLHTNLSTFSGSSNRFISKISPKYPRNPTLTAYGVINIKPTITTSAFEHLCLSLSLIT